MECHVNNFSHKKGNFGQFSSSEREIFFQDIFIVKGIKIFFLAEYSPVNRCAFYVMWLSQMNSALEVILKDESIKLIMKDTANEFMEILSWIWSDLI